MNEKKSRAKKLIVLLLAAVLLVGCSIGGTLAYLQMQTAPVVNTFSATGIALTLTETGMDSERKQDFKLVPGMSYAKDPKVTITGTTGVDYYVFVKVEETDPMGCVSYEINGNLIPMGEEEPNVYYKEVAASSDVTAKEFTEEIYVLGGRKVAGEELGYVTISKDLTATDMEGAANTSLSFTAYAIQQEGFDDAADAWIEVSGLSNNG